MKQMIQMMFIILFISVIAFQETEAQQWRQAVSASHPAFRDVFLVNATTGWAVSSSDSVIYKTTDAGLTWKLQAKVTTGINCVYFVDANNGYAVGSGRTFLRTTNGGTTWSASTVEQIPETGASIRAVYFATSSTGWILSSETSKNGRVLKTTDGGATWDTVLYRSTQEFNDMHFADATHGVVVGKDVGTLYYTPDGKTWNKAPVPTLGGFTYTRSDVRGVYMANANTAYAVGWGTFAAGLQPSIHLKTTDGGANWTYITQTDANRTYDNLYAVWFKDALNGIAVGGALRGSIVVRTTDGGQNWIPLDLACGSTLYGVSGYGNTVIVVGSGGVIFRSTNFGDSWTLIADLPSATLYTMQFTSSTVGYAAGYDGLILKTTNGGVSWKPSYIRANMVSPNINDIYFLNDQLGYATCSYRLVAKTTNGGATWAAVIADTMSATVYSYGVWFSDQNNGFVVGQLGSSKDVIYRTTNGGSTWSIVSGIVNKALRAVAFGSTTIGAAVGDGLKTLYTTDGGSSWSGATVSGVPSAQASANLYKVAFVSANTAVAVGNKVVIRSTDGGATWQYINSGTNADLRDVAFATDKTGYAVGGREVLKTTDGGLTWQNVSDTLVIKTTQYSVGVDGNADPWTGSTGSIIYTKAPLVSVKEPGTNAPGDYYLAQNYPNPFNPTTTIEFALPRRTHVLLKVYNVLGQTVSVLLDEVKPAGNHTVHFDGARLTSGVYWYELRAGEVSYARKMVIMK